MTNESVFSISNPASANILINNYIYVKKIDDAGKKLSRSGASVERETE